jgi:chromosome segregation and condensation protein ScpB
MSDLNQNISSNSLEKKIEALLFISPSPVSIAQLSNILNKNGGGGVGEFKGILSGIT